MSKAAGAGGRIGRGGNESFREFTSTLEMDEWQRAHWNSWAGSLTSEQLEGTKRYTGSYYEDINEYLRQGVEPLNNGAQVREYIAGTDGALARSRVPENVVAYRGSYPGDFANQVAAMEVGDTMVDKGFMSTSINQDTANGFGDGVSMKIRVPKNMRAAYVRGISNHKSERELLLPRNTSLRAVGKSVLPNGTTQIEFEVVNP